jgi:hypothetical protein
MRGRMRRLCVPVALAAAAAFVVTTPGTASAQDGDGLTDLVNHVEQQLAQATAPTQTGAARPSTSPPAPTSDDDLPGHETQDPAAPDHGAAKVADVDLGDNDVADLAQSRATTNDDDSTASDATLLALGGQEVLGAHADSTDPDAQEGHFGDPLAPLCEGSSGALCLKLLYADAWATDDGSTSHADSRSGVAAVCLGGTDVDATECDGPIGADVATSKATSERDQASGRTTADSESDAAGVCLAPDATTGGCAFGIGALHSAGDADSAGTADRESYLVALDGGGEEQFRFDDPTAIAIQPECAAPSLICLYLNQGETYVADGIAGHAQEALDLRVLPETPIEVGAEVSRTETLAHNDGGTSSVGGTDDGPGPVVAGEEVSAGGAGGPGNPAAGVVAGVSGLLPNTGGIWSGLLAGALLALGSGALLMANTRRRRLQLG